jgi:hypothetical protein
MMVETGKKKKKPNGGISGISANGMLSHLVITRSSRKENIDSVEEKGKTWDKSVGVHGLRHT